MEISDRDMQYVLLAIVAGMQDRGIEQERLFDICEHILALGPTVVDDLVNGTAVVTGFGESDGCQFRKTKTYPEDWQRAYENSRAGVVKVSGG